MKRLRILTLCSVLLAAAIFLLKKRNPSTIAAGDGRVIPREWLATGISPLTPESYRRPADQTFLTFPEWFLVFSPDEQAQYFKSNTATSFPFMQHTQQIWQSYSIVNDHIRGVYPYNRGYHFMIWVIGSSASIEYSIKAWYETFIGRLTNTRTVVTAEDRFNADVTQAYVSFIKDRPWYEFNFKKRLMQLWQEEPMLGDHLLRKLERRYLLTSELLVKFVYGKLIGLGTQTVYDTALPTTGVVVSAIPADTSSFTILKRYPGGEALLSLPRYDQFKAAVTSLAKAGISFKEVAGNRSAILLTILLPIQQAVSMPGAQVVFTQPIASAPETKRVAVAVPVAQLHTLLLQLTQKKIFIEHIFDF